MVNYSPCCCASSATLRLLLYCEKKPYTLDIDGAIKENIVGNIVRNLIAYKYFFDISA